MWQCVTTTNNSSQERQVKASHYKMRVVMQVMIQGPSAKQPKPHTQCVTQIHGERSHNALSNKHTKFFFLLLFFCFVLFFVLFFLFFFCFVFFCFVFFCFVFFCAEKPNRLNATLAQFNRRNLKPPSPNDPLNLRIPDQNL